MSGSSQNPVQNRVVKQYVDAVKTTAEAAYTRSSLNLGRINTIQEVDLPDIYYELADLKEIVFETVAAVAAYVVDPAAFFVTPSYITIDNVAYPVIDDTDAEVAEILGSTVVSEGDLVDFEMKSITSRGFNQWNEEWEVGLINTTTGENQPGGTTIRSKNHIGVIPGNTYYIKAPYAIGSYGIVIFFYDSAKNYIRYIDSYSTSVAIPNDCAFIRFQVSKVYGTTYNNDICVNVSNASFNGQYKPYRESSIDWESVIPNDEDRTARSAGTARDVIYVREDGNDTFSIVKRKKIDVVNLGTLNWTYQSGGFFLSQTQPSGIKQETVITNLKCPKYSAGNAWYTALNDGEIVGCLSALSANVVSVCVKDTSYADAASFKAAMSDVVLNYELNAPEETVLASGLLYDQVSFLIERGGTIAINGGMPDALPGVEIDIPVKRFNE